MRNNLYNGNNNSKSIVCSDRILRTTESWREFELKNTKSKYKFKMIYLHKNIPNLQTMYFKEIANIYEKKSSKNPECYWISNVPQSQKHLWTSNSI